MDLQEDKPSLDELAHHGVKGQKWGVTRDRAASVGRNGGISSKPTTQQIHDARAKTQSQIRRINQQIDKTNTSTGKQQEREAKKLVDMHDAYLKNPDRATAMRMTKGEKWVAGIGAVVLPGVGTAAIGVTAAARVAQRKSVENYLRSEGVRL